MMEITTVCAITAASIISAFVLTRCLCYLAPLKSVVIVSVSKHLTYPYSLDRHHLIGPWTRAGALFHLLYLTANLFCLLFLVSSVLSIKRRAGGLSLVNKTFLFAASHLGLLADILGVSLHTCRKIHRVTGWMSALLLAVHVVTTILTLHVAFPITKVDNLFAVIVSYPFQNATMC